MLSGLKNYAKVICALFTTTFMLRSLCLTREIRVCCIYICFILSRHYIEAFFVSPTLRTMLGTEEILILTKLKWNLCGARKRNSVPYPPLIFTFPCPQIQSDCFISISSALAAGWSLPLLTTSPLAFCCRKAHGLCSPVDQSSNPCFIAFYLVTLHHWAPISIAKYLLWSLNNMLTT